uniref:SUMO1/sentrin specific peptidase 5 n=1 Tax=Iconisemion striatum TaxID=60296 RepID=A0A1A7WWX7_9TELE
MVHSNSSSPMKTTPSASPHQTGRTSTSDSTQAHSDGQPPVPTTSATALHSKSRLASVRGSAQTPTPAQGLVNGRTSGRKRTPKACDCCGPHSAGHNVKSSGRGRGAQRGRGRGRGAVRDLEDTPKRKVEQLKVIRNFDLAKEKVQKTEDEDNPQETPQTYVQVADTHPQTLPPKSVPATSQDGPITNCATPNTEAAQSVLMTQSGVVGAAEKEGGEKKDDDTKLQDGTGSLAGRGRGRGRGRGQGKFMAASKVEVNIQVKSRGRGRVISSGTGALAHSALVVEPEGKQSQMDQNDTGLAKCLLGNGDMVSLSDSDEEMKDDTIIVGEHADELLLISLQSTPSRLESSQSLDSEMQVDQISDQNNQISLSLTLPNGNTITPTDREHTSSPMNMKTSSSALVPPPDPIKVSSTECLGALRDHRLYCHPGTWAKDETTEVPVKNQAEENEIDADTQNKKGLEQLTDMVHEFLESFYIKYGSFIPLSEADVLEHLKKKGISDFKNSGLDIRRQMTRYRAGLAVVPVACFMVTYNKHTLRLEDLNTLEDQSWVNDQIINMYGELIMEATEHKVHFFNSFFYKQLVAKGYEGVKRWTKKADLFSKWLLLIPIHLEIHWSLISVNMANKTISYYDSQGIVFRHTTDNIMKYLQSEAREKKQAAFQKGWKITIIKSIPQQKNDSDCGVFVLEYCRCLSLKQPLLFSQDDMPRIRKRIYKELCDCHLNN